VIAIMLAAGIGRRLSGGDMAHPPKVLLRFNGRSLLERHLAALKACGVRELAMVLGYQAEAIQGELARLQAGDFVTLDHNPDYLRGSTVSLWAARQRLRAGEDVLFMDGDVLYHPALLARLARARHGNCLLLDRDFVPGDEPVKLCLRAGQVVEFRKRVEVAYDMVGEWPGFLRLSAQKARDVADRLEAYVAAGRLDEPCEEVFRDVMLADPTSFGVEDVTGEKWIEIDFPEDVIRAEREILPLIDTQAP
jgi:choline kinase